LTYAAYTVSSSKYVPCARSPLFSSVTARYSSGPKVLEPGYGSAVLYHIFLAVPKISFRCHRGKMGHITSASSTAPWKEMAKQQRTIMEKGGGVVSVMDAATAQW